MITNEVSEVFREYLDLSNLDNLRLVNSLNETSQNQFLVALTSKLYDKIQAKATKIDYSSVEYSRGDIQKIQNYGQIVEALDILKRIVIEYHENPAPVDTVIEAIMNLRDRKQLFGKAFVIGSSLPILVYNNIWTESQWVGWNVKAPITFTLPSSLKCIEDEAFAGITNCIVRIPDGVAYVSPTAFDPSVTLVVTSGSTAANAVKNIGLNVIEE